MSKYPSFYELLHGDESIPHTSHLVENFSGDDLDPRWTLTHGQGSGSGAMNDTIDGGYRITTGASASDRSGINFNQIRQFSNIDSINIGIVRRNSTGCAMWSGFGDSNDLFGDSTDSVVFNNDTDNTNLSLRSVDSATASDLEGTTAIGTDWTQYKIELTSSNSTLYVLNVLEVTKSTNLPTARMQPFFGGFERSGGANTIDIRYMECYNK